MQNYFYIFFCLIVILSSCKSDKINEKLTSPLPLVEDLQEGDLVLRLGNSWISTIFQNYSRTEKLYSHIGIICFKHDSAYVIHSEASEYTGIGGVMEENLGDFLSTSKSWAVYRFDTIPSVRAKISEKAKKYLLLKTPFDTDFYLSDDSKIYCTELVANAVNQAYQYQVIRPSLHKIDRYFYRLDDCYLLPKAIKVCALSPNLPTDR